MKKKIQKNIKKTIKNNIKKKLKKNIKKKIQKKKNKNSSFTIIIVGTYTIPDPSFLPKISSSVNIT